MKKLILGLALSTFLIIGGCNKSNSTSLTFSSWGSIDEINILKPILADFTKSTGINVELIHIPDNYYQKIHMMFASETEPDVIFLNNLTLPVYADSGVLENMEPWLAKTDDFKLGAFYPQVLESMKWKSKLYGIPRDISNLVIYYNQDMFDRYHIPYPHSGWSMGDFQKTAFELSRDNDGDGNKDTYGFFIDKRPLFWLPFVWSFGGDVLNDELNRFSLDTPESIAGLEFYVNLRQKYNSAPSEKEVGNTKAGQLFSQEKIGMQLSGRWSVPTYRTNLKFRWDVVSFPQGPKGSIVDVDSSGWVISKSSKKKEQAWELVKFLGNSRSIGKFSEDGLIVPSRIDIANSKQFLGGEKPRNSKVFLDSIKTGRPIRTTPNWSEISNELELSLEDIWNGNEVPQRSVSKASARINALLK